MAISEIEMLARNSSAHAKMLQTVAAIQRGELVEGYNCTPCVTCGAVIEFTEWDVDGPQAVQPQGFKCADHFVCDGCGDREQLCCNEHLGFEVWQPKRVSA
jgi:heterodisulfide reductase subunit A-like polyferredoxin